MNTKAHINSFEGGIDQDTSVNKYSNNSYYDAEDVRIVTNGSLSNGCLVNINGNDAKIKLGDEIVSTLFDGNLEIGEDVDESCLNAYNYFKLYAEDGSSGKVIFSYLYDSVDLETTTGLWLQRLLSTENPSNITDVLIKAVNATVSFTNVSVGSSMTATVTNNGTEDAALRIVFDSNVSDAEEIKFTYSVTIGGTIVHTQVVSEFFGEYFATTGDNNYIGENVVANCVIEDALILCTSYNYKTFFDQSTSGLDGTEVIFSFNGNSYKFEVGSSFSGDDEYLGFFKDDYSPAQIVAEINKYNEFTDNFVVRLEEEYRLTFSAKYPSSDYQVVKSGNNTSISIPFGISNVEGGSRILKVEDYSSVSSIQNVIEIFDDQDSTSKLNFDTSNHVSIIGRYEDSDIRKIYWINGIDPLRYFNIDSSAAISESNEFDYVPEASFGSIDTSIVNGGNYKNGVVFYAYQYFSKNGAASTFSSISMPNRLDPFSEDSTGGGDIGEDSNKSVFVTINNLSSDFSRVRIIAIFYDQYNINPTYNIVDELTYNNSISNPTISLVDTGNYIGSITLEEFRIFANTTLVPNVLETKNNYLFIADIKEDSFSSDTIDNWDSRAYAFDKTGEAKVYQTPIDDGTSHMATIQDDGSFSYVNEGVGTTGTGWGIPEVGFNAVNRSNSIFNNSTYKPTYTYCPDVISGTDIVKDDYDEEYPDRIFGGKGKNLRYYFKWYSRDVASVSGLKLISNKRNIFTNTATASDQIDLIECQPDEVYRVGVRFINSKGQSSFVKWIGDIRWPFVSHKTEFTDTPSIALNIYAPVLHVEITSFPSDSDIVSYQIVRVKLDSDSRTINSTGLVTPTYNFNDTDENISRPFVGEETSGGTEWPMYPVSAIRDDDPGYISDRTLNNDLLEFISPETIVNNPSGSYAGKKLIIPAISEATGSSVTKINTSSSDTTKNISALLSPLVNTDIYSDVDFLNDTSSVIYNISDSRFVETAHYSEATKDTLIRIGDYSYINQFVSDDGEKASRCSGLIIKTESDLSIDYTAAEGDEKFLIGYIVNDVDVTRYGGYDYNSKTRNEYIAFSDQYPTSTTIAKCTIGNSYRSTLDLVRALFYVDENDSTDHGSIQEIIKFILHSNIDTRYCSQPTDNYVYLSNIPDLSKASFIQETVEEGITLYPESYDENIGNLYVYNNVYSQIDYSKIYFQKPYDLEINKRFPNKIIASEKKINGEFEDSWTKFYNTNFIEVDGRYGNIMSLNSFKNKMIFFQENNVGILSVNDRSLIQDSSGNALTLGNSGILDRFDYIAYFSGIKEYNSVIESRNNIYYLDSSDKKIYTIDNPNFSISEINGVQSLLENIITSGSSIYTGFDPEYREILFTIDNTTIAYNESIGKFVSKYNFIPNRYIHTPDYLYTYKIDTDESVFGYVFKHNDGDKGLWYENIYGQEYSTSKVVLIVNPNGNIINTFDNLDLRTEVFYSGENFPSKNDIIYETVSRIKYSNSYIDEISIESATSSSSYDKIKRLGRAWRSQIPLTSNSNRFVDSYIIITLEFDNNSDKLFKLHDVITKYRQHNI